MGRVPAGRPAGRCYHGALCVMDNVSFRNGYSQSCSYRYAGRPCDDMTARVPFKFKRTGIAAAAAGIHAR